MKYTSILLLVLSFVIAGCSDNNDEPKPDENKLIGYWAITHTKIIEHNGEGHNTYDKDVPPHGIDSYINETNPRWDVLIFDEDFVTVRGDMPNRPKGSDYDLDTIEGQIEYNEDLEKWYNNIGKYTDNEGCSVGSYSVNGNKMFFGSLYMGLINFTSDNEFTLEYRKNLNNSGDYKRLIYTYTRIYSLIL